MFTQFFYVHKEKAILCVRASMSPSGQVVYSSTFPSPLPVYRGQHVKVILKQSSVKGVLLVLKRLDDVSGLMTQ